MTQTLQILKIVAPEFANNTDTFLNTWIGFAATEVRVKLFGTIDNIDYQKAVAYLTAAKIKISKTNGQCVSGSISRQKVGDIELEYNKVEIKGNTSILDNAYMAEYKRLLKLYTVNTVILTM